MRLNSSSVGGGGNGSGSSDGGSGICTMWLLFWSLLTKRKKDRWVASESAEF